jgi:hypothetical protein
MKSLDINPDNLIPYREAFKRLICAKYSYFIDKGNFDGVLSGFVNGDSLVLDIKLETIPNDIIFMRTLAGNEITLEIEAKVRKLWDEQIEESK